MNLIKEYDMLNRYLIQDISKIVIDLYNDRVLVSEVGYKLCYYNNIVFYKNREDAISKVQEHAISKVQEHQILLCGENAFRVLNIKDSFSKGDTYAHWLNKGMIYKITQIKRVDFFK